MHDILNSSVFLSSLNIPVGICQKLISKAFSLSSIYFSCHIRQPHKTIYIPHCIDFLSLDCLWPLFQLRLISCLDNNLFSFWLGYLLIFSPTSKTLHHTSHSHLIKSCKYIFLTLRSFESFTDCLPNGHSFRFYQRPRCGHYQRHIQSNFHICMHNEKQDIQENPPYFDLCCQSKYTNCDYWNEFIMASAFQLPGNQVHLNNV